MTNKNDEFSDSSIQWDLNSQNSKKSTTKSTAASLVSGKHSDAIALLKESQAIILKQKEAVEIANLEAEKLLKAYEELYENAPTGYFTLAADGKILETNQTGSKMLNGANEDLANIQFEHFVHLISKGTFQEFIKSITAGENTSDIELKLNSNSSPTQFLSLEGSYNATEEKYAISATDITKEKLEKHELKLLSSVITNTMDAVLITEAEPFDEPGPRILYVNDAFCRMTGYSKAEVIGKTPRILQGPKSDKEGLKKLGIALRKWDSHEITTVNYRKNGDEFWINFTVTPVTDENGWYTHWIAIERDVTEQVNDKLALKKQNEELSKLNEELDRFVYSVTHDLRSPLTSILGLLGIMKMSEADKEKLYHLDLIEKRITNLDDFIQDILSYSKNKKNPVLTEKIEFKKAINEILDAVLPIEVAQINIRIEIEDVIPFYSSHERVYAVLNNLISNAIKYRNTTLQNSFIKISVLTNIDGAIITIEDNGVGIKEAYLPKIFDMFYRATTSQTGSGLGLYMVKEILENIKGEITVKSTAGEGTTFVVNLKNMINEVI